jgi:hypothetical protein
LSTEERGCKQYSPEKRWRHLFGIMNGVMWKKMFIFFIKNQLHDDFIRPRSGSGHVIEYFMLNYNLINFMMYTLLNKLRLGSLSLRSHSLSDYLHVDYTLKLSRG